jgi:hypothetical protein
MPENPPAQDDRWLHAWLETVAGGLNTMNQRKLSSILKHAPSLEMVKAVAEQKGVHLLLLEDDEGSQLVAASTKPFTVIC